MGVQARYEAFTPEVRELARQATTDGVQTTLAGSAEAAGTLVADSTQELRGGPVTSVLRRPART